MNAAATFPLAPQCPQCHRHSYVDSQCIACGLNCPDPRPCGCTADDQECDECCELSGCDSCGEEGIPVRVLAELGGLCPRCSGVEAARDAAIEQAIDQAREGY